MVPIYAVISTASFILWDQATALLIIRDAYESVVLTAFFYLLLLYLHPGSEGQKEIFRKLELPKWVFPLGFVKWKPQDGLFFLQLMKWGILQYCFLRPTTSIAAVVLDLMGLYCVDSWSPGWGHIYITVIQSVSVTVAMYCLIQFYVAVSDRLKPHKPLLKLFSVKAVVFLTFWQATLLSGLSLIGVVKDTETMTADDINIGIGALAETFEMMLFALLHLKAFTYKPYADTPPFYSKLRALGHALDPRETFYELWVGTVYMWRSMRGQDGEGTDGFNVRRRGDLETAFGKTREYNPRRGNSWYQPRSGEKGAATSEKVTSQLPDHYLVSALGDYRPVRHRREAWDEDEDWDAGDDSTEHTPLTLRNLQQHDVSIGSPSKSKRKADRDSYRPVSSLIPEHDLPRISPDLDPRQMTLEDPPPHSTLHTYKHMRGPELRRQFNRELGFRTTSATAAAHSSRAGQVGTTNHGSLQPTKLSEKMLYPSLSGRQTQQTASASSDRDEFYDFDEAYVHDAHADLHDRTVNVDRNH